MNYQKTYQNLIERAQRRLKPSGYLESHHIVPRALKGSNDVSNLVYLTAREHCLAHLLLARIHGGTLWHAVHMMTNRFALKSRAYAKVREQHAAVKALSWKNGGNPLFGVYGAQHPKFLGDIIGKHLQTGIETVYSGKQALLDAGFHAGAVYACIRGERNHHRNCTFKRI